MFRGKVGLWHDQNQNSVISSKSDFFYSWPLEVSCSVWRKQYQEGSGGGHCGAVYPQWGEYFIIHVVQNCQWIVVIKDTSLVGFSIVLKVSIYNSCPIAWPPVWQPLPFPFTLCARKRMAAIPSPIFFQGGQLFPSQASQETFPLVSIHLTGNLHVFEPMPVARRVLLTDWLKPVIIYANSLTLSIS